MLFVPTWHEHSVYIEQYLQKTSLVTTTLSHFFFVTFVPSWPMSKHSWKEGPRETNGESVTYRKWTKGFICVTQSQLEAATTLLNHSKKEKKIAKASRWGLQSAREGTASTHSTGRAMWRAVWIGLNGFWSCLIWPCACYVCLYVYGCSTDKPVSLNKVYLSNRIHHWTRITVQSMLSILCQCHSVRLVITSETEAWFSGEMCDLLGVWEMWHLSSVKTFATG